VFDVEIGRGIRARPEFEKAAPSIRFFVRWVEEIAGTMTTEADKLLEIANALKKENNCLKGKNRRIEESFAAKAQNLQKEIFKLSDVKATAQDELLCAVGPVMRRATELLRTTQEALEEEQTASYAKDLEIQALKDQLEHDDRAPSAPHLWGRISTSKLKKSRHILSDADRERLEEEFRSKLLMQNVKEARREAYLQGYLEHQRSVDTIPKSLLRRFEEDHGSRHMVLEREKISREMRTSMERQIAVLQETLRALELDKEADIAEMIHITMVSSSAENYPTSKLYQDARNELFSQENLADRVANLVFGAKL
jgi:hypothetical protein